MTKLSSIKDWFSCWVHLVDHERNGQTGKSMKRFMGNLPVWPLRSWSNKCTQNKIQYPWIKKCAKFLIKFYIKSACFKWLKQPCQREEKAVLPSLKTHFNYLLRVINRTSRWIIISLKNHGLQIETVRVIINTPITSLFKGAQLMKYAVWVLILLCCAATKCPVRQCFYVLFTLRCKIETRLGVIVYTHGLTDLCIFALRIMGSY